MAKKKIYQLDAHSSIVSTDVFPISLTSSGDAEKQTISGLTAYMVANLSAIPATSISDGSISNTEFGYLNGVTGNIQTQIDGKASTSHTHTTSDITNLSSYTGFDVRYYTETEIDSLLSAKQDTLVSGTNIKTINGTSLLGSGDITISGGGGAVDSVNGQTGVVVLDADDIDDTSTTNKFVTAGDITKLSNLSGTNTGDQTSIVGITGTKAEFDTAVTDGNFLFVGDITQYTDEQAQDAVGTILTDSTEIDFTYNDGTPSITASIVAGSIDESKLDTSVNASLDLADTAVQPAGLSAYFNKSVDDTDDITEGVTNKFATASEKTKLGFISVTQPVDLDTIESDTATNNAKVTNATHTGEVTGSGALTVDKTAITNKTVVTADGADYVLISDTSDTGNLKKVLVSDFGGSIPDGDKGDITTSASGATWTIDNDVVTFAKMQNIATNKLLGRGTAGTGDIEEITLGTGLSLTGTTLNATAGSALSTAYTLSNITTDRTLDANSVTLDELADVVGTVINDMTQYIGYDANQIRIRIPGELVADTSNYQGIYWRNLTGTTITISNVAVGVGTAAAGSGAACSVNVYKSSGTAADGLNTSAVALFSSAIALSTGYTSDTNVPDTTTVEDGRWITIRVTSSAGATNKASDLEVIISYS